MYQITGITNFVMYNNDMVVIFLKMYSIFRNGSEFSGEFFNKWGRKVSGKNRSNKIDQTLVIINAQ